MEKEEQLVRIAKEFGNGAHIFVPKQWAGEHVILIKRPRKGARERIISVLEPYLENIIGAYLYGSYARGEQSQDSDIDLLVITNKKIKIKEKGFEIICLQEKNIDKAIKLEPVLLYSILSEAKPIINLQLLSYLRSKYKPKLNDFKEFFESSKRVIQINEGFLDLEEGEYLPNDAVIYSLVLRLRGIFIIRRLLQGKNYSHGEFIKWVLKKLPEINFNSIYSAYKNSKNELKIKQRIKMKDLVLLMEFLKKEIDLLEDGKA